ncbi:hydrogenase accessory protein, HypB [Candidatus Moduliflexus flocculans]|uniref:Hydrogenase accessory protein, HypB n=1 Tax=Candidatus Moduliflexus flocculans TaxID=1499966 RepID=A0A081BR01_9BACT|nr:hydrogenase accessory protein, HypB [Candidatus Moduliflexus flocculans]
MQNTIIIGQSILAANDEIARSNRLELHERGVCAINVMAAPGAGKTSLIVQLLESLPNEAFKGVIEGDVASSVDTEKILAAGFPAVQINTGGGCHLTAKMIQNVLPEFQLDRNGFLFIENIGNLICPCAYDLGEDLKLVISSVPEGDDKPVKYPKIFQIADVIALNKTDYLTHSDFDLNNFLRGIKAVNPGVPVFQVSCKQRSGIDALAEWIAEFCRNTPDKVGS